MPFISRTCLLYQEHATEHLLAAGVQYLDVKGEAIEASPNLTTWAWS